MVSTRWLRLMIAVLALLALGLFAACGDDDDDDDGGLGGLGGDSSSNDDNDDEGDSGGPSGPGGGDEEEYVDDICGAFNDFTASFSEIMTDPENQDIEDPDDAVELFKEPYEDLVNALEDANPPDDVEEFHEALLNALKDTLEALEDGDENAFEALGQEDVPEPSDEVSAKYEKLALENEKCQQANFDFGE